MSCGVFWSCSCLLCNSCGVTNMQSRKQKSTLWTMQVGIFDGLVDDILYHLWIIPQSWFSQKRLRIHSIERLALNVAKRMLPGFINSWFALPRCYRICAWTEHAIVKAEEYTANNGGWNIRCISRLYFLPLVNHYPSVLNSQSNPFAYSFDQMDNL